MEAEGQVHQRAVEAAREVSRNMGTRVEAPDKTQFIKKVREVRATVAKVDSDGNISGQRYRIKFDKDNQVFGFGTKRMDEMLKGPHKMIGFT